MCCGHAQKLLEAAAAAAASELAAFVRVVRAHRVRSRELAEMLRALTDLAARAKVRAALRRVMPTLWHGKAAPCGGLEAARAASQCLVQTQHVIQLADWARPWPAAS